ncbi:MAG: type II secretion system minor pseudopilin GspI [Pseudomonadota bacterium]
MRRAAGFSLLEVLVALLVVAISIAALSQVGGRSLDTQAEAEARTLALWVADNALAELRLDPSVSADRRQGSSTMGDRDWYWDALIQPAPGDQMLRVDVLVYAEASRESPVVSHTGFLPL